MTGHRAHLRVKITLRMVIFIFYIPFTQFIILDTVFPYPEKFRQFGDIYSKNENLMTQIIYDPPSSISTVVGL